MIKMVKGMYGLLKDSGVIEAMTKDSAPFSLPEEREKQLVDAGVALYIPEREPKKSGRKTAKDEKQEADDEKV